MVNYNQKNQAKNITKPVLIIAGEKDTATPLYMQKKLNKLALRPSRYYALIGLVQAEKQGFV